MRTSSPRVSSSNEEDIRVGATIKALREARGLTQEQLAQRAQLSRPHLANVEVGRKRLSVRAAARVADALVVPQIALIAPPAPVAA